MERSQADEDKEPLLNNMQAERDFVEDTRFADPYPYKKTRLRELPYRDIIKRGIPWNDPTFPHGP